MAVNSAADLTAVGRGDGPSGHLRALVVDPETRGGGLKDCVVVDEVVEVVFGNDKEITAVATCVSSSSSAPNPAALCCRRSVRRSMLIAVVDIMDNTVGDVE
jgi:hypothetical protein